LPWLPLSVPAPLAPPPRPPLLPPLALPVPPAEFVPALSLLESPDEPTLALSLLKSPIESLSFSPVITKILLEISVFHSTVKFNIKISRLFFCS
jgi:hypothetical protein